jgi:hypothetical protein
MYKTNAAEIVAEALRLGGLKDSKALTWSTKIRLLNNTYREVRDRIARTSETPWIRSFVFEGRMHPLPRDLQEIETVREYINEEDYGPPIEKASLGGEDVPHRYYIRGGKIALTSEIGRPILVSYTTKSDAILFTAPLKLCEDVPPVAIFYATDDEYSYYEIPNDPPEYFRLNLTTLKSEPVDEPIYPAPDYGFMKDLTWLVEEGKLEATIDGVVTDVSDYFIHREEEVTSIAANYPYLYVSYADGVVDGFEYFQKFHYNPFISKGRRIPIRVDSVYSDDETGYGLIILKNERFYYGGFTETTVVEFPSNAYWAFLEVLLALNFSQSGLVENALLTQMYTERLQAFERMLYADGTPTKPRILDRHNSMITM